MDALRQLIEQNRSGQRVGLPCFCTANEFVLRAVLAHAAKTGAPTVIEATCNQVNQDGGYTGMTPQMFIDWLTGMAAEANVAMSQIILGGDHLGPNPWSSEPIEVAMEKARALVRQYVEAGFTKIHLDASMACGGEANPTFEQIAERAAELCSVAERFAPDPEKLFYIIGTEVPIPGGETEEPDVLDVTSVARYQKTIDTHRSAWEARGLQDAWGRIVSVVTQPGVDFGHSSIYPFEPERAADLGQAILSTPGLTFEAHSTDYQSNEALADLVSGHFFFLKVGPELTFRFREAIWALADIETQTGFDTPSNIRRVLDQQMDKDPAAWRPYYKGNAAEIATQRIYSYSDRIRYYWANETVAAALEQLLTNLRRAPLAQTLVSQSFGGLEFGDIPEGPDALIERHIQKCVARYCTAAGQKNGA